MTGNNRVIAEQKTIMPIYETLGLSEDDWIILNLAGHTESMYEFIELLNATWVPQDVANVDVP